MIGFWVSAAEMPTDAIATVTGRASRRRIRLIRGSRSSSTMANEKARKT